ncbi:transposase [Streptomyces sp. MUM 136J]|uniref:transposase n=1 Tax=Streptomyces sp. MUM 136J TaxID=2791992 RepID=UPI001F044A8E|nr:transposase [Streptomyces sp. MUM 136J]
MTSRKRIYDAEFREGAVRIVTETGKPIPEVAEDLGVHPGTLHSWVSRARRNGSPSSDRLVAEPAPGSRLRESERAELERLRAEAREKDKRIRELEMERDVHLPIRSPTWAGGDQASGEIGGRRGGDRGMMPPWPRSATLCGTKAFRRPTTARGPRPTGPPCSSSTSCAWRWRTG